MKRLIPILSMAGLSVAASASQAHPLTPQGFVRGIDAACPRCKPYLVVLRGMYDRPKQSQQLFVMRRKIWFHGASRATAQRLARRSVALYAEFYRLLSQGKKPASTAKLMRFTRDDRVGGAIRSSAAWLLYLATHRTQYAATALRLHGFETKIFDRVRDTNFPAILEVLLKRVAATPRGTPARLLPATVTVRYYYLTLVKAAMFQHVPKKELDDLFMLYRRMLVPTPGMNRWVAGAVRRRLVPLRVHFSPSAAPQVAKALSPYGHRPLMEFLRALARQGLVLDLAQVMHDIPADKAAVNHAVGEVAATAHGQLKRQLNQFLKSPPKVSDRPWLTPSRREALKIYQQQKQAAKAAAKHHHLPPWLAIAQPLVKVRVGPGSAFAHAVFTIRNKSENTLRILRLWTSCTCTSAKVGRYSINAGDALHIRAKVRMAGLTPPFQRYVFLLLGRGSHPKHPVKVRLTMDIAGR